MARCLVSYFVVAGFMAHHWANADPSRQNVCCYPLCKSRRSGLPAQVTKSNRGHRVGSGGGGVWADLAREHPKIFNNNKGRDACTKGLIWLHESCATALRRLRPATGINLCVQVLYHYHFLIHSVASTRVFLVCRSPRDQAHRCHRDIGLVCVDLEGLQSARQVCHIRRLRSQGGMRLDIASKDTTCG